MANEKTVKTLLSILFLNGQALDAGFVRYAGL